MRIKRTVKYLICALCAIVLILIIAFHRRIIDWRTDIGRRELRVDEEHMKMIDHSSRLLRQKYPRRHNMSECAPLFGRVGVLVAYIKSTMETHYAVAQRSLECYLKSVNYTVFMVDLDNDERVKRECPKNTQLFFRKHCAAAAYLKEVDWMLVLDADTAVVNPNHCIEEWIDTRVDVILYERYFNWEIAAGNYLAKNTEFARNFLKKWADWEFIQPQIGWNGGDNGVLQIHLLETLIPSAVPEIRTCYGIWLKSTGYDTYLPYVTCCKMALGATRLWPGKVRIYRRAHGWVRDGWLAEDGWAETDFMLHGYKQQQVGENGWKSPFTENPDPSKCGAHTRGWPWRKEKMWSVEVLKKHLSDYEDSSSRHHPQTARVIPYLQYPDVGDCFPHCDDMV